MGAMTHPSERYNWDQNLDSNAPKSNPDSLSGAHQEEAGTTSNASDFASSSAAPPEYLPWDFVPGNRDVILGKAAKHHSGNDWCKQVVASELQIYQEEKAAGLICQAQASNLSDSHTSPNTSTATHRTDKNDIVNRIVAKAKASSQNFVRMDHNSGRWVRVVDEQAHNKVMEIMQEILQGKRNLNSPDAYIGSAPSLLNRNFLEEYVSKHHTRPATTNQEGTSPFADTYTSRKRRRFTTRSTGVGHPTRATGTGGRSNPIAGLPLAFSQQHLPHEDLQLQRFLGILAQTIPDVVVGDPFEPDPLPNRQYD